MEISYSSDEVFLLLFFLAAFGEGSARLFRSLIQFSRINGSLLCAQQLD